MMSRAWIVVAEAFGHLNADDGWAMASHVALSGLMAIFPFLIFVAALAGFIGEDALAGQAAELLFRAWPAEVAGPIAREVEQVVAQAHGRLLTLSAGVALLLASNGVEATRTALNRAYRVVDRRSIVSRWVQSAAFVLAGAVASLVLAFAVLLGPVMLNGIMMALPASKALEAVINAARFAVSGLGLAGFLVAAHVWLPANRPHWLDLWPGIALTVVLWSASAVVFAVYLGRFANLAATYAGLASVVAALFFLYVAAVSLIFGAEFNAALGRLRDGRIG